MPPPRSWGASTPQAKPMAKPPSAPPVQPGGGLARGDGPRCPDQGGGGSGHLPRRPPAGSQPGPLGSGLQTTPPQAAGTGMFAAPLYSGMRRGASPGGGQPPPAAAAARVLALPAPAAAPPTPAAPAAAAALSQGNLQAPNGGGAPSANGVTGGRVENPPGVVQQGVHDPNRTGEEDDDDAWGDWGGHDDAGPVLCGVPPTGVPDDFGSVAPRDASLGGSAPPGPATGCLDGVDPWRAGTAGAWRAESDYPPPSAAARASGASRRKKWAAQPRLLARTSAPWTRSVRRTLLLLLRRRLQWVGLPWLGPGPGSRRSLTRVRPVCPLRRRPTRITGRGIPRLD